VDLQANYERFRERGAEILALAVQDVARAKRMQDITAAAFPILADPDHTVATQYGVFDRLKDGVAAPSVFIIDSNGHIVWSYIGRDPFDRPAVDEIIAHLPER
jgi:peroxiredoxin